MNKLFHLNSNFMKSWCYGQQFQHYQGYEQPPHISNHKMQKRKRNHYICSWKSDPGLGQAHFWVFHCVSFLYRHVHKETTT
jgi:hypothetical protein